MKRSDAIDAYDDEPLSPFDEFVACLRYEARRRGDRYADDLHSLPMPPVPRVRDLFPVRPTSSELISFGPTTAWRDS